MRRVVAKFFFAATAIAILTGCDPKPSTQLAPDVKPPDTSGMSKEEILKLKQQGEAGKS